MFHALKSALLRVLGASMFAGQTVSTALMGLQGRPPASAEWIGAAVLSLLGAGACIFFSVWTWRRLARMRDTNPGEVRKFAHAR